ncbi:WxL domain-containing protein [Lactiplantibacillus nangangensis]|uniref:WxL domain-containing protein n=1 Tax=Lactiplantibacillus nangangensis TaxID=2559917 RepID=A0ABW1SLN7_9LACO|nr:WxL domain-containing protein [Lactiplantibacillus nangangensis]
MKKSLALAAVLGVATLLATPVVGNAAEITSGGTTTATVGLEQDPSAQLALTKAPTIEFGSEKIGAGELHLKATSVDDDITVENPGLADGWQVTVAGTQFTSSSSKTLTGAELKFAEGTVAAVGENSSEAPASSAVTVAGDDSTIFSASQNAGLGTWGNKHELSDVTLDIPAGNVAGTYTSTLTWTLTSAPTVPAA